MGAAAGGFAEPLRALLARGASVEFEYKGKTPLMAAASGGHDLCARALLEAKADLEAQMPSGHTVLMLSAQNGHEKVRSSQLEYVDSCGQFTPTLHTISAGRSHTDRGKGGDRQGGATGLHCADAVCPERA